MHTSIYTCTYIYIMLHATHHHSISYYIILYPTASFKIILHHPIYPTTSRTMNKRNHSVWPARSAEVITALL